MVKRLCLAGGPECLLVNRMARSGVGTGEGRGRRMVLWCVERVW